MISTSPVCSAIRAVLSLYDKGSEYKIIHSYKSEKDFIELWKLVGHANSGVADTITNQNNFVIVWDGIPERNVLDSVNIGRYLSPIDWGIAYTLSIYNKLVAEKDTDSSSKSYPPLKILIIDTGESRTDSDTTRFFKQFPRMSIKSLPWIRIFTVAENEQEWDINNFISSALGVDTNSERMLSMSEATDEEVLDLGVIRNFWAASLTKPSQPGDHHAIANMVGPLLLIKDKMVDCHITALLHLLTAVGLLPRVRNQEGLLERGKHWINWSNHSWLQLLKELRSRDKKIHIILIDDQYKHGWDEVLQIALDVEKRVDVKENIIASKDDIILKAFDSAEVLLQKIESLKESIYEKRFAFSINNHNHPEILFLDLRLFAGDKIEEEKAFFERLLSVTKHYLSNSSANLPWPSISASDIEAIDCCIQNHDRSRKLQDENYISALTLLPRLLALIDPSLPIIVFSSTGRRDVINKFKEYGNIVTLIDKPKFSVDVPEDIAKQTKDKFINAISDAIRTITGRLAIQDILKTIGHGPGQRISGEQETYVEIFIDESGDSFKDYFVIGGLALLHKKEEDAIKFNNGMENTDVEINIGGSTITRRLTWFGPHRLDKRLGSNPDEEVNSVKQILPKINELLVKHHILALPFVLRAKVNEHRGLDVLHNEHLDNLYLILFREALDALIYEMIPFYVSSDKPIICRIMAGTRARHKSDDNKVKFREDEIDALRDNFGIKVKDGFKSQYYQSLSETSFIPIVSNVIFSRIDSKLSNIKICGARGVKLQYDSSIHTDIRNAHYLADLIAHFDYISIHKKERDIFKFYFPNRIVDNYDDCFRAALDASKHLDANDIINALLCAHYVSKRFYYKGNHESIILKIMHRVGQSARNLSGDQFKQFALLLDIWDKNYTRVPSRKVQTNVSRRKSLSKPKANRPSISKNITNDNIPSKIEDKRKQTHPAEINEDQTAKHISSDVQPTNYSAGTSNLGQEDTTIGIQNVKVINIIKVKENVALMCKDDYGNDVVINPKETESMKAVLRVGMILSAKVFKKGASLYGKEIRIVNS